MRILEFTVIGQSLVKKTNCDFSHIVTGTAGYIKAQFNFLGDDWDDCVKVANFHFVDDRDHRCDIGVMLSDDACFIPKDVLTQREFYISVLGGRDNGNYIIRTTDTKIVQEAS